MSHKMISKHGMSCSCKLYQSVHLLGDCYLAQSKKIMDIV